ncbi:nucleoside phosphorylase domain-containing protein [Trichoderma compactum]
MEVILPRRSPNCSSDDLGLNLSTSHQVRTELPRRRRPINREEFKIAIICALPLEYDAIYPYGTAPGDANTYTTGRIGDQNVVLALLQRMGRTSTAPAVASMKLSYTGLRQAFLVGICGGVPRVRDGSDIMLGDRYPDGFIRKYTTTEAQSNDFRGFVVMAETMRGRNKLRQAASKLLNRLQDNADRSGYGTKYAYPGLSRDKPFESNYRHKHHESPSCVCKECHERTSPVCDEALSASCKDLDCSSKFLVSRARWIHSQGQQQDASTSNGAQMLAIHIGSVTSAGIWDGVPCLVIGGVSDCADSHKHSEWQDFAAATAAAATSALLMAYSEKQRAQFVQFSYCQLISSRPYYPGD